MKWTNVRKLKSSDLLEKIEKQFSISFPREYKDLIGQYNAGIPDCKNFNVNKKKYQIERLISANLSDNPNIYTAMTWVEQTPQSIIIPIALDILGNMIALNFEEHSYCIVFINFENGHKYFITQTLEDFISILI